MFISLIAEEYLTMKTEDALDTDVPLLFISFPSTKDPQWDKHPQRQVYYGYKRSSYIRSNSYNV